MGLLTRMALLNIFILAGMLNYSFGELPLAEVSTIQLDFNSFVSGITKGPSENLTVTDEHAVWNVDIDANPPTKHLIAGSFTRGYREGTGSVARFSGPRDVVILNDTLILVTDQGNHCLRAIDLHTNSTSTHAGLCGSRGNTDGRRLDARFYNLVGLLNLMNKIFITDWLNNAIRKLESDHVTTLSAGSPLIRPDHFTSWSDEYESFFVTVDYGIARIDLGTEPVTVELVSGSNISGFANGNLASSRYSNTLGIDHLDEHTLAVADEHNDRLRIIDLKNNKVTSICSGVNNASVDGNRTDCSFNVPWGVRIYKDMILVGEKRKMRRLPLYSIAKCGEFITNRTNGTIKSPNHPVGYYNNLNCTWIIEVAVNQSVSLKFEQFELEAQSLNYSCQYDYLEVRDGNGLGSPVLAKLCGAAIPETIQTESRYLTVSFMTDSSITKAGFKAIFTQKHETGMEPEHTTSFTHPATTTPEQRTPVVPSGPEKLPLEVSTIQLDFNSFVSSITIGPSGNLIVTDVHAVWNVDIEVNPPTKHLIAGSSSPGHVEGTGSVARFRGPRDVVMLNDSLILVTDQANHCLRAVDLHTNSTSTYAGLCGSRGNTNGHRLDARFYHLIGLLKLMNKIFISDFRNNAIRKLESDNVTTLSAGSPLTSPEHFSAWSDEFFFVTVNYGIARINLGTEPVTGELVSGSNFWGFANGNLSSSRYTNTLGIDHLDEHTLAVADEHNDRLRIVDLKNNNVTSICSGVDNSSVDGNGSDCSFNVPWGVRVYKDMILVGEKDKIRSLPLYSIIAKSANESERTTANKESVNTPGPEPITPAPIQGPESVYLSLLSIVVIIPVIVIVVVYCKRRRAGSESSADGERDINMVLQQKSCHERPLPHEPPCVWEDTEYAEINPETGAAKEDQEEEPYMRPTDSSYIEVYELPDSHRTASLYKNLPNYN